MAATNSTEHYRYESTEFDYEGCVVCDANGDTLGWPCPEVIVREYAEQHERLNAEIKRLADLRRKVASEADRRTVAVKEPDPLVELDRLTTDELRAVEFAIEFTERFFWRKDAPPPEGWAVAFFRERGPARPERAYTYPPGSRTATDVDAWLWLPPVPEDVI